MHGKIKPRPLVIVVEEVHSCWHVSGWEEERSTEFEGFGVLEFTMKIEHGAFDFHGVMQG
jgi:hypothetical protein